MNANGFMTAREMIEFLSSYDPETPVVIVDDHSILDFGTVDVELDQEAGDFFFAEPDELNPAKRAGALYVG